MFKKKKAFVQILSEVFIRQRRLAKCHVTAESILQMLSIYFSMIQTLHKKIIKGGLKMSILYSSSVGGF